MSRDPRDDRDTPEVRGNSPGPKKVTFTRRIARCWLARFLITTPSISLPCREGGVFIALIFALVVGVMSKKTPEIQELGRDVKNSHQRLKTPKTSL